MKVTIEDTANRLICSVEKDNGDTTLDEALMLVRHALIGIGFMESEVDSCIGEED